MRLNACWLKLSEVMSNYNLESTFNIQAFWQQVLSYDLFNLIMEVFPLNTPSIKKYPLGTLPLIFIVFYQ